MVTPGPHLQAEPPGQKEQRAAVRKGNGRPGLADRWSADRPRLRAETGGAGAGSKVWGQQGQVALARWTLPQETVGGSRSAGEGGHDPRRGESSPCREPRPRAAPFMGPFTGPGAPACSAARPGSPAPSWSCGAPPQAPGVPAGGPPLCPHAGWPGLAVGLHTTRCGADRLAGAGPGAGVKARGSRGSRAGVVPRVTVKLGLLPRAGLSRRSVPSRPPAL